jgi:serine phosphatase RsbU (regulator of sigma subunit)
MIKDASKMLKEQEIRFEKNDIFILYTDGITEAINQSKKDGNEERF